MKKLVLIVIVVAGVWLGVNYVRTGSLSFSPPAVSGPEEHLRALQHDLDDVNSQIASAGRAAGMTGMDTTSDVSALMAKKDKLEKEIAEARARLKH
jgi:hypothetical protein